MLCSNTIRRDITDKRESPERQSVPLCLQYDSREKHENMRAQKSRWTTTSEWAPRLVSLSLQALSGFKAFLLKAPYFIYQTLRVLGFRVSCFQVRGALRLLSFQASKLPGLFEAPCTLYRTHSILVSLLFSSSQIIISAIRVSKSCFFVSPNSFWKPILHFFSVSNHPSLRHLYTVYSY